MKKKVILNISMFILIISVILLYGFVGMQYEKTVLNNDKNINSSKIEKNRKVDKDYSLNNKDITNILIIGSDARVGDKKSRSDTIMIFSLDRFNKSIKLISVMRDTYAAIPGYTPQKINHAFAYGGPELLRDSIETNFGLDIHKYVVVDFSAFKRIIDIIGGIDVELTELDLKDLNNCMYGLKEKNIVEVKNVGMNHLNGTQTLAYARMRHNGKGIYDRSKRQRDIVETTIEKSKNVPLTKYPGIIKVLMESIETDVSFHEALKLSYVTYSMKNPEVHQMQIPPKELSNNVMLEDKGWVIQFQKEEVESVISDFIYK